MPVKCSSINNDGSKHRKESRLTLSSWARKNNFPKDVLRLSCYNCNCGRQLAQNKVCPHQYQS